MTPERTDLERMDLDWQAFLYVSGDLSAMDAAAFEQTLANDLAACEAVARAARLMEGMRFAAQPAEPVVSVRTIERTRQASPWGVIAAAACVIAAAWGLTTLQPEVQPPTVAQPEAAPRIQTWDAGSLVALWSQARTHGDWRAETTDPEMLVADSDAEIAVPSWMLAAVRKTEPAKADADKWQEN